MSAYRKITTEEKIIYNYGILQAQFHITKAMLALDSEIPPKTKRILKFIYDEIGKELK